MDSPATSETIAAAWNAIGAKPAVAEQALDLECEISVMAARSPSGEVRVYPAARNHHENQILAWSVLPAGVPAELESRAQALVADLVAKLGIEGLLCAEIFITRKGELFINELAPRPHNSYHQSERGLRDEPVRAACARSLQFAAG
ncbi:MAG: ATP-grasp domain-containing protein [Terracidiphilus sp.]